MGLCYAAATTNFRVPNIKEEEKKTQTIEFQGSFVQRLSNIELSHYALQNSF